MAPTIAYYDLESEAIDRIEGQRTIRTIHCISVAIDDDDPLIFTSRPTSYSDGTLTDAIHLINSADFSIGHNIIGFDKPVLEQVLNIPITSHAIDTLILSKLTFTKDHLLAIDYSLNWQTHENPSIRSLLGSFSLEAFGLRLGNEKIDFNDWSQLSEEMCTYCKQDVVVTRELHKLLLIQDTYPAQQVIDLEMEVGHVIALVAEHGFYVDRKKAEQLRDKLLYEQLTIRRQVLDVYKPLYLPAVVQPPHTTLPAKARKLRTWVHNPYFEGYWVWRGPTKLHNQLVKQPDGDSDD